MGVLAICLANPFPLMDHAFPFSAHMIGHTAMQLIVAPLLALAIPAQNPFKKALMALSGIGARYPVLTWFAGVGIMWVWHLPALYNAMPMMGMSHQSTVLPTILLVIHSVSLLIGGFIFCWPLVTPYKECRLTPLAAVLYLGTACVFCSLLGLLIAFAPPAIYHHTTPADRQTGGLIMWVPCCFLYLAVCMYLLINWLSLKSDIATAKTSTC
jgi:putative membrane protein